MKQIEQQFLTSDQLAERYGLSPATIADWRRKDKNKKDSEKKIPELLHTSQICGIIGFR